jgi:ABC-type Fe3+-hydroxamate transport system substrate-binding protein
MTPRPTRTTRIAVGLLAAATIVACGTSDDEDAGADVSSGATTDTGAAGDDGSGSRSAGCESDVGPTSTGPITLTDSFDRTVELDGPAERVAVLEWQQVEDVLALCATPVAVADVDGYATWVTAEALPEGVTDVGSRNEPNLDALFAAEPDLIIVEAYTPEDEIIGQLEAFGVPVLATRGADAADPVENMLGTFRLIGDALGRGERAEEVVAEFEADLAAAEEAVAAVDLASSEFVYLDGYIEGGNVALRPFGQGSLVGEIGEALGLTNAWTGEVDEAYGLGQTDIEGMAAVGDAMILYTGTEDPTSEDVIAALEANPIWNALPAVAEGRVHAFPPGTWTFGGPRSTAQVLDAFVDVLTS